MAAEIERRSLKVDVSHEVDLAGRFEAAVDLVLPPAASRRTPPTLLFCLPGGFLSRRYFDLGDPADPVERSYSFADAMARRGYSVAAVDHLGTGDSTRPSDEDGYTLGVDAIARANQAALGAVLEEVGARWQVAASALTSIGVGHSMGSALTVVQQANHTPHAALILQSFSSGGLPKFLQEAEAHLAGHPELAHAEVAGLVRDRYGTPYPQMLGPDAGEGRSAAFSVGTAPALAERLLVDASTNLLAICGTLTLIPGAYAPYAERVSVPVFVSMGDHDLLTAQEVPPMLPHASEVVAHEVADCWHCHNVANSRQAMWDRMAHWLDAVVPARG